LTSSKKVLFIFAAKIRIYFYFYLLFFYFVINVHDEFISGYFALFLCYFYIKGKKAL